MSAASSPANEGKASQLYTPLSIANYEIRILTLLPNIEESSPICCTLEPASLFELPQYNALSYCWGDPIFTETVYVNDFPVEATTNLVAGLRQLRTLGKQNLWVDALCINEKDLEERAAQVLRMRDIYSNAVEVVVWLGPADVDSETVLDLLGLLAVGRWDLQAALQERNVPAKRYSGQWKSWDALLARPYWRRVWVIQEIAVAPLSGYAAAGERYRGQFFSTYFATLILRISRLFVLLSRTTDSEHSCRRSLTARCVSRLIPETKSTLSLDWQTTAKILFTFQTTRSP